jgi:hypothetical protein
MFLIRAAKREKTNGNTVLSAWRFETRERMGGALVLEEEDVSSMLIMPMSAGETASRLSSIGTPSHVGPFGAYAAWN